MQMNFREGIVNVLEENGIRYNDAGVDRIEKVVEEVMCRLSQSGSDLLKAIMEVGYSLEVRAEIGPEDPSTIKVGIEFVRKEGRHGQEGH